MSTFKQLTKFVTLPILGVVLLFNSPIIDAKSPSSDEVANTGLEPLPEFMPPQDDIVSLLDEADRLNQLSDVPAKPNPHLRKDGSGALPAIKYAITVPGQVGYVFAPGRAHIMANILDVRGMPSGIKARDPETGEVFLVP